MNNQNKISAIKSKKTDKKTKIAYVLPWVCLGATVWTQPTYAEGSRNLYPATATGSRANLEWRTGAAPWGGILPRRTLLKVYAQAGEVILLGSSGMNIPGGQGDIVVYSPGQVTGPIGSETVPLPAAAAFRCSDQPGTGRISSRAQELAGPNTIPPTPNTYTPCVYPVTTTGIYDIAFIGPGGFNSNVQGAVPATIADNTNNFDLNQGSSVSSWDVTVRTTPTSPANIDGRLFSYGLSLFTGGNGRPVNSSIYTVTRDGYRYQTDMQGMDPNGFLVYGNSLGYLNSDGVTPLYRNVLATNSGNPNNNANLSTLQGGVSLARPEFPIFLSDIRNPTIASEAENILFQLGIPSVPVIPTITSPTFQGNAVNNTSFVGNGGTFSFNSNTPGTYEIIIQGSGSTDFDPSNPLNRVLLGTMTAAGPQSVSWDGRANNSNFFPVGLNYPARLTIRAGEYHFPLLDIENSVLGGPNLTMINPPTTHPLGVSQAFFDDRGYTTLNGTNVGTPNTILCGNAPPPGDPAFPGRSNPITGYNTITQASYRAFGVNANAGNSNTPCTGSFGDVKGLDLWAYFPSQPQTVTFNIVSTQADMSLTKTGPSTAIPGTPITYTVTVTNGSPIDLPNIAVTDDIPAEVLNSTWTCSVPAGTGSCPTPNGTGDINTTVALNSGATATFTINGTIDPSATGTLTNTASTQPPAGFTDPNGANNTISFTSNLTPTADLGIAKTDNATTINPGGVSSYVITVTNNGPSTVNSLTVADTLPAGFTASSYTASTGTFDSATGNWTGLTLASGQNITLTITGTVSATATGTLTNTATVSPPAGVTDSNPNNNTATDTTTVVPEPADLSLQKTLDTSNPTLGGNLTYTVTLRNTGPAVATNVAVTDQLPAGLTYVSHTASQGTYDQTTGLWTVGNVAVNGTITLQITATLNTANSVTNTAQITASDQTDPDSIPNNNNPSEDDQSSITLPPLSADLRLAKTVDNSTPTIGQNINFTLTVTNDGPASATNVQITDTLPAGLTFVSASNGGTYNPITRQIVWNLASVANGANVPLTVQATVNNAVTQSNRAEITASDQPDPDSIPNNGNINEDDYSSVTLTSELPADLAVIKTVDNPNPTPGQTVNYTITLSNLGPGNATNVQVTEPLATGLTFVSATSSQGTYDSSTGLWNAGNIANGSSVTLTIRATVTTANPVTNTAQVTGSDQTDPNPANNSSSVTIPDLPADLAVTKIVDQPNAALGQTLNYTITLTNNGPGNASDVAVTDQIPAGLTFLSATSSQGSYDAGTGVWTVGNVANGGAVTLTISARVNTANPITNTAQVTASDQTDPVPGNNSATVTTPQQAADLVVAKSVDNPNPTPGQQFTYSIVVTNAGPANATGVQITDQLPAGVNFVSAIPSAGTYDNNTGLWNIGNLNNGAAATLRITAVLNAANATNTASVTASNQPDPNLNNNQDSVTVPATGADLSLAKTANVANPRLGDTISYTLTLRNSGPSNATGVQVTDRLPAGLTFVSASGTYDPVTGVWTVGNVATGGTATLTIQARKTAEGPVTNSAQVTASDQPDPDSTVNNNNPSEDDQASLTLPQDIADLSLSKTSDNLNPSPGTTFTYTVTLRNSGPATATGVQVLEQVPAGLSFVSARTSNGTYDQTTGLWNVGEVTNGGTATLSLTVTLNTSDVVTNTAQVQASDQGDPDSTPGNNNPGEDDQASLSLPSKPRLRLVKRVTALNGTPFNEVVDDPADVNDNAVSWPVGFLRGRIDGTFIQPGDEVEYTVYFLSDGGALAANVNLCDLVPAGLQFIGDAFGTNRGVSLLLNNSQTISTNAVDGDVGQFFAAGSAVPNSPCKAGNTNGAVIVNLGNLPSATGPNSTNSYGFFRFRARFLQ